MRLSDVANITDGVLTGPDLEFEAIATDSRTIEKGQVFLSIVGEKFDGHNYIEAAVNSGAIAVITSKAIQLDIPSILVTDTTKAYGQIAAAHRQQYDIPVVGLTGSCGKTTTRAMITTILSQRFPTLTNPGNFNNYFGVPSTLLDLNKQHGYAVIEMGANSHGEIAYLSKLVEPTVALITNINPVHIEGFGSLANIAEQKGAIYQSLSTTGLAIINRDCEFYNNWLELVGGRKYLTFGQTQKADVYLTDFEVLVDNHTQFFLHYLDKQIKVTLPLLGKHNALNALAASAVAIGLGFSLDEIKQGLEVVKPVAKRLLIKPGLNNSVILDDSYSANPASIKAAMSVLSSMKQTKKILVFGAMAELGPNEKQIHKELGQYAHDYGITQLLATGDLAKITVTEFGQNARYFTNREDLIDCLKTSLDAETAVLVKGSNANRMWDFVNAVVEENISDSLAC